MANSRFSFIKFSSTISDDCSIALPIVSPSDIAFFFDDVDTLQYTDKDGTVLGSVTFTADATDTFIVCSGSLHGSLSIGDCFRLKAVDNSAGVWYSNILRVQSATETSLLKYYCDEAAFDFPYNIASSYNQLRLPIRLFNAQFPQKETVYIDTSGNRKVLSASLDTEKDLETEYIPESWHEALIAALSHDHVLIDGVAMTKSEEYKINWDEYIDTDCGERLTKGSTKMQYNITYRNSNCV